MDSLAQCNQGRFEDSTLATISVASGVRRRSERDLKLELHSEPHVERQPIQQWLQVIDIWRRTSSFPVLIRQPNVTVVGHIKEIRHEPECEALVDLEWIVGVQIESREEISPSQLAAATNRYFTGIKVDRVSEKFTDRNT